jgi:hypothetical protein
VGFIIRAGRLDYRPESILEAYDAWQAIKEGTVTGDYQYIQNPAYNQDRGPVSVFSIRLHWERLSSIQLPLHVNDQRRSCNNSTPSAHSKPVAFFWCKPTLTRLPRTGSCFIPDLGFSLTIRGPSQNSDNPEDFKHIHDRHQRLSPFIPQI